MNDKGVVYFKAKGHIYNHNKEGKPTTIKETRYGSGVVKSGADLMGMVFRQCTNLLPCGYVTVKTYTI